MASPLRPVAFHAGILLLGGVAASLAWSKEKTPHAAQEVNVTVWNARPSDIQRIAYETKTKKLNLEAREEKKGERWFYGTAERIDPPPAVPDGGTPPAPPPKSPPTIFASTTPANKLAEAFAPLKGVRSLGKIPDSRVAEFGFEKKENNLSVTISGKERKLVVGGTAPGGTDTYVLDPVTSEAYVLKGDALRDLDSGEMKLMEHDQHGFKETDTTAAKVVASGKTRQLVRGGPEGKKFWADPADKEKADETAGNWMQKIDRLRVSEYASKPPDGLQVVVRVEYTGAAGNIGFIEVAKTPPVASTEGAKPDYWIVTEHTHLYGKVYQSAGEQVEQDVGSVVK
jgi:hypothetical protein